MYIYIERERERERGGEGEIERGRDIGGSPPPFNKLNKNLFGRACRKLLCDISKSINICIYIYICSQRNRFKNKNSPETFTEARI